MNEISGILIMSISHSILASLAGGKPCSGYDLAKQFNTTVGFFWHATHQQIYRELSRMEREGLVVSEVVVQEERPDKKLYRVTAKGKELLIQWLSEPSEPSPVKEDLLAKLHVGYLAPENTIIEELLRHRKIHSDRLDHYLSVKDRYFSVPEGLSEKSRFRYLILKRGIMHEEGWIEWFDLALETLKKESVNSNRSDS